MNINRTITSVSLALALSTTVMLISATVQDRKKETVSPTSMAYVKNHLLASTRFSEIKGDADKKPLYDECVAYCKKVPTYSSTINAQKKAVLQSAQDMLTASQACMAEIAKIEESGKEVRAVDVEFLESYYGKLKTAEKTYLDNFNKFKTAVEQMSTPKPTAKPTKKPVSTVSPSGKGGNGGNSGKGGSENPGGNIGSSGGSTSSTTPSSGSSSGPSGGTTPSGGGKVITPGGNSGSSSSGSGGPNRVK